MYQANSPYTPSGKTGRALVLLPSLGLLSAFVLAVIYAYVNVYSPIGGYISILFVLGFAFGLGLSVSLIGHTAKCRSKSLMLAAGFALGLVGFYCSWAAFEYALLNRYDETFQLGLMDLLLNPVLVLELAKAINVDGWYSIRDLTPKGGVLWAFWAIEALIVIGGTTLLATGSVENDVFCEDCDDWCGSEETDEFSHLAPPEDPSQIEALRLGSMHDLNQFKRAEPGTDPVIHVETWLCESCQRTAALQLKMVTTTVDKDGKTNEEKNELTPITWVESSLVHHLRAESGTEAVNP